MKSRIGIIVPILAVLNCLSARAGETLAKATQGRFLMGVAVNSLQVNGALPLESGQIAKEFNALVAENCMKPGPIHPEEDRYNWEEADKLVAFGEKNHQVVTGHCLIWHSQLPRWFFVDENGADVTPEILKERMRSHIHTVVGRYKGRIKGWDVVNEAFEDNGSYRNSKFYRILGKEFIRYAFQFAHEADPDAELYYNDYSMEVPAKCDAVVELVKQLRAAGCRIDAVGSQSHIQLEVPSIKSMELSICKLRDAGVKVLITEWDVSILPSPYNHTGANISDRFSYSRTMDPYRDGVPDSIQEKWNKRVLDVFGLFLQYSDVIDRVTVWGLNDKGSWMNNFPIFGRMDYPVLFDRANNRKVVVDKMIRMAQKTKSK
jgi:endo-1,4-beta-xylanase